MSRQYVSIKDPGYRAQIIDSTLKSVHVIGGITNQFKKFNKFLTDNKRPEITIEQYTDYLKNDDINKLNVP